MGNELCCASLWSTEGHSHPRIVQQHDLFGVPEALSEFGELHQKLDEAYNKNHDAAVAALFTDGMFSGRQDIEKRYPPLLHPINWSVKGRYDTIFGGAGGWRKNVGFGNYFCVILWAIFCALQLLLRRPDTRLKEF
jgi:hypothetical protein